MEATKAIKPVIGDYYQFDGTPVPAALWREVKECLYVEPDESEGMPYGFFGAIGLDLIAPGDWRFRR